jgi:hypothetical protein
MTPSTASTVAAPLDVPARASGRAAAHALPELAPGRPAAVPCPECGAAIAERFCGQCGEARPTTDGLRMRHLLGELLEHLTSLDFRLARTLVALVRHPGRLTRDFVLGRRGRYTRPLALYLLVSGAFFLITPHLPMKPMNPRVFIDNKNPAAPIARHFDAVAARHGETRATMADRVAKSPFVGARYAAALLVPGMAAILTVLLLGRRRLLAEHVLFAIHAESFLLVVVAFLFASVFPVGYVAGRIGRLAGVRHLSDAGATALGGAFVLACTLVLGGHLHAALRRVYALGRWGAAWRAAALLAALPFAFYFGQFALVELVAQTGLR